MIYDVDIRHGYRLMPTVIDLPDAQIKALAVLCERVKQPRAAVIREAVAECLERRSIKSAEAAYGLWRTEAMDGLAYQERTRAEW
jgi:predicted transcriptional regulator